MKIINKIAFLLTSLIPKKKKRLVFGSWGGKKFADNAKYLYLYYLKNTDYDVYWVTKDHDIFNKLVSLGYPCVLSGTFKSFMIHCTASAYFWTTFNDSDTDEKWLGNSRSMNLFHGVGPKKIGVADDKGNNANMSGYGLKEKIKNSRLFKNKTYLFTTSEEYRDILSYSLSIPKENVFSLFSQPRNDVFFNDTLEFEDDTLPFEKDRYVILYMPTHRQEGRKHFELERILPLDKIEEYCQANNCLFVINRHFYHLDEIVNLDKYTHIIDVTSEKVDTQLLLKYSDVLITDYSSCYVDYLLLKRPIIYYCFDIEEYQDIDRDFYFPFDTVTPGEKIYSSDALISTIGKVMNGSYAIETDLFRYALNLYFGKEPNQNVSLGIFELIDKSRI